MAILQQGYVLKVECDCGCKRVARVDTERDFQASWYKLMQLGWVCQAKGWHKDAGQEFRSPHCGAGK